jgi:hypothetical protein
MLFFMWSSPFSTQFIWCGLHRPERTSEHSRLNYRRSNLRWRWTETKYMWWSLNGLTRTRAASASLWQKQRVLFYYRTLKIWFLQNRIVVDGFSKMTLQFIKRYSFERWMVNTNQWIHSPISAPGRCSRAYRTDWAHVSLTLSRLFP